MYTLQCISAVHCRPFVNAHNAYDENKHTLLQVYMLAVITGWFVQLIIFVCILKLYVNYIITQYVLSCFHCQYNLYRLKVQNMIIFIVKSLVIQYKLYLF